jgi:predicted permease
MMRIIAEWLRRIDYLIHRRRYQSELEREMQAHREMMREPRHFGNTLRLREEARDVWGWNWLDDAWRDVKFASRALRRSPGFTLGATLVLTLGIGLNITLFQIYNLAVLKPLDVRNPETLVELHRFLNGSPVSLLPYPAIEHIRKNSRALASVLVSARQRYVVWENDETRLPAHFVSANWFGELGGKTAAGRLFVESIDGKPDATPVVILSYLFWEKRLGSDPGVVGSRVRINDRPATIIGILAADYSGMSIDESRMWMPMEQIDYFFPDITFKTSWVSTFLVQTFARLKAGMSVAAARESLRPLMGELALQHPQQFKSGEWLEPYPASRLGYEDARQRYERMLGVTGGAFLSLLVLTIACANLSNMVLSRSLARVREMNIRAALGAGRWRVMRLLIAESALIAVMGTVAAVALSSVVLNQIAARIDASMNASVDWRTITAALGVAGFAMFAVGFIPTWAVSRRDLTSAIKDAGQNSSAGPGRGRLRSLLTAIQVAGSCLLLLVAALTARNVQRLLTPGYEIEKLAILDNPPLGSPNVNAEYLDRVRQTIAAMPDVEQVAFVSNSPVGGGERSTTSNLPESPSIVVTINNVEPQFFGLMRIPIVMGRNFDLSDDSRNTIIISRRIAMKIYGTLNVVGQPFPRTPFNDRWVRTIVGVAEDVPSIVLEFPQSGTDYAKAYLPLNVLQAKNADLLVRARTDAKLLLAPMREAARTIDKRVFVEARLLSTDFATRVRELANLGVIAFSLAALTLVLACAGIFGVISYGAKLRSKEISIRFALGAGRGSLISLLMRQSMRPAMWGMLFGLAFGVAASWMLESQRIYFGSIDARVVGSVSFIIAASCALAALIPAWRALRADIAQTLRGE